MKHLEPPVIGLGKVLNNMPPHRKYGHEVDRGRILEAKKCKRREIGHSISVKSYFVIDEMCVTTLGATFSGNQSQ